MAKAERATLTFLGAAGTVTGSKYLMTFGDHRILVDAGMFQGEKKWRLTNWNPFPVPPASIADIVLTHAHMDHVGYLPALVKGGFAGQVWMTRGTRELAEIVLRDSAHLQEIEAAEANEGGYSKHKPALALYTTQDVEMTLPLMRVVEFGIPVDLGDGVTAQWERAGHILGSASILVQRGDVRVLFSGDLGRDDHPILKPRAHPPGAPYVVMESTYGDREHPDPVGPEHEKMAEAIRRTIERGGSVLIPAFAIDRTELVLKALGEMRRDGRIPSCPIWVNSPMALSALDAYRHSPDELRPDVNLREFADLSDLHEARTRQESMDLTDPMRKSEPSIIVSSSGMASGGRVVHHLAAMLPDPKNSVILTGYQAVGTRGRLLIEGEEQLKMYGKYVPVRAEIIQDSEFSVHGDASDLLDWLRGLSPAPENVFLVHGEPASAAALGARIKKELGLFTVVPRYLEVINLNPAKGDFDVLEPGISPVAELPATVRGGHRPGKAARHEAAAAKAVHAPVALGLTPVAVRTAPPEGKQPYRCLTGRDDDEFCRRVSEALAEGYVLHGGPALAWDGKNVVVAQAIVWPA